MKKLSLYARKFVLGAAIVFLYSFSNASTANPKADPEAIIISDNARFTVLTPEMIRIEYSDKGVFEDRATFTVQNRKMDECPFFERKEDSVFLYISTDKLHLRYRKGTNPVTTPATDNNLSISFQHNGVNEKWFPGKEDPLNLKGTCRTLDSSNGDNKRSEMENGLISRSGWAVINDSWSNIRPDGSRSFALEYNDTVGYDWWAERKDPEALDLYFLGYGTDYKRALHDFTRIAGSIPLPPDYVFGYWYSRYAPYTDKDYRQIMTELQKNDIPADVIILDMDWHWNGNPECKSEGRGGWTGWSWNKNLIPDPEGLLEDIHDNGYRLSLNLHPADGIDSIESPQYFNAMTEELGNRYNNRNRIKWSLDYPDFTKSFFENIIRDHEREGVDFWWIDWQQYLTSDMTPGLGETFWCNHVFFNDMKTNRPDRRPVIFHRWGGLGSHRYQIGFSGDALINFPTLAFQPYFTSTASNVGYAFWGHDLGGHAFTDEKIVNDPELMLRWIQFGVFTPIFRSHATNDKRIERRMWKFSNLDMMREAVRLRYSLFPYIYTMARKTYDTGIGMCRPLYYEFPEVEEAYDNEGEYFFGDDILVAPVTEASSDGKTSKKRIWFPAGKWYCASTDKVIEGPCTLDMDFSLDQIPYFYRAGSIIPLNPPTVNRVTAKPDTIILRIISGADGDGSMYEDKGDNSDYATEFATTEFTQNHTENYSRYKIGSRMGSDSGLPGKRAWILEILDARQPSSISINGHTIGKNDWNYDNASRKLNIYVPTTDCSKPIDIYVNNLK